MSKFSMTRETLISKPLYSIAGTYGQPRGFLSRVNKTWHLEWFTGTVTSDFYEYPKKADAIKRLEELTAKF